MGTDGSSRRFRHHFAACGGNLNRNQCGSVVESCRTLCSPLISPPLLTIIVFRRTTNIDFLTTIQGGDEYMNKLLTVDQAADRLGLKASTIRAWILRRKLGFTKVGAKAIRVPEAEVERVAEAGFVPPVPERGR
jgi:excisionase family DNA binding protein